MAVGAGKLCMAATMQERGPVACTYPQNEHVTQRGPKSAALTQEAALMNPSCQECGQTSNCSRESQSKAAVTAARHARCVTPLDGLGTLLLLQDSRWQKHAQATLCTHSTAAHSAFVDLAKPALAAHAGTHTLRGGPTHRPGPWQHHTRVTQKREGLSSWAAQQPAHWHWRLTATRPCHTPAQGFVRLIYALSKPSQHT